MFKVRKKQISGYLREVLEDQIGPGDCRTKNKAIADELVKIALDPKLDGKLRLNAIEIIMDRMEGKAVAINLNAEIVANPFEDIDTSKLETMRNELLSHEKENKTEETK